MRISDWSSDVCSSDLALDARETVEARGDLVVGNAHVQRHRDRSERVLHIVASRHRQVDARNRAAIAIAVAHHDVEAVTVGARRHIGATHVGLGRERSEEHTSELQSLMRISYAVFCLKKKTESQ